MSSLSLRWWWLDRPGARVRGYTVGAGPPLLLLHGGRDNARCWYEQLPVFARSFRVIAFDARAHGETRVFDGDYSTAAMVADARAVLDAERAGRAAVIGYSMGAAVAVRLALAAPERVSALVLVGFGGNADAARPQDVPALRAAWERDQALLREGGLAALLPRRLQRLFSPAFSAEAAERYCSAFLASDPSELLRRPLPDLGIVDLAAVSAPTLVVAGEADAVFSPQLGRAAAAQLPNARFVAIPGGHACHLESPALFNAVVEEFLASHVGG
ncbi:MAG: alpha/beta hydrolase [Chloroflexota bacterium]|nr:alpha/beta hydrolase [Dehalococcoidia bacterium]MDW8253483.1 alpha/beta hydrolase [Chloroflexota bacterium]